MGVTYDKDGRCTVCRGYASGFIDEGLCNCLEVEEMREREKRHEGFRRHEEQMRANVERQKAAESSAKMFGEW